MMFQPVPQRPVEVQSWVWGTPPVLMAASSTSSS
jgi:hypothetical protein